MKKTLYITAIATMLAGSVLTGCSDFLDAENKSAGGNSADNYFSQNPEAMLTSAYISLKDFTNQADIYDEGTDLYASLRGAASTFEQHSLTPETKEVQNFYVHCYGTINYANGVIKYAAPASDATYRARFIRAYAYYVLMQNFGAVPYVTKYIDDDTREYPRPELGAEYASITEDLTDLYNNSTLPAEDHTSGHPSKQAVAALLSKLYLAWAWDIDVQVDDAEKGTWKNGYSQEHFNLAAQWATKAIGNNTTLPLTFAEKWDPANEGNIETIFSVKYDASAITGDIAKNGNDQMTSYGGYYSPIIGSDSKHQQTAKSLYLFDKEDLRYDATFMTTFYDGTDVTSGYFAFYKENETTLAKHKIALKMFPYWYTVEEAEAWLTAHKSQFVKGTNAPSAALQQYPNITKFTFAADGSVSKKETQDYEAKYLKGTQAGVKVRKFDDPEVANYCYRDIVLMHLSDIYLVAAEAYLMAGDMTNFLKYLNAVRSRAGIYTINALADYQPQYEIPGSFGSITWLDLLLDERGRECYAEKTRHMDLRRTKQLVRYNVAFNPAVASANSMKGADGCFKWLRPIPQGEMDNNTALTPDDQNEGYK